jgi:predicted transcriptional regulator
MRRPFVLDKNSSQLLDDLAETCAGNRSLVAREAIGEYAAREASLEEIESDPQFVKRMESGAADIRAGRVSTQEEVERRLPTRRKRRSRPKLSGRNLFLNRWTNFRQARQIE